MDKPNLLRLECLDIIRGALAWTVVWVHILVFSHLLGLAPYGQLAVNGFIVLSGFVIALTLTRKKEPYRIFIARRAIRLFPVYLVCLALALAVRPWTVGGLASEAPREASENTFFWQHLAAHLPLAQGLVPDQLLPNGAMAFLSPAWSLSVELQLYFLAPFLVGLMICRPRIALVVLGLGFVLQGPGIGWHLYEFNIGFCLPRICLFMVGAYLFLYLRWEQFDAMLPSWSGPFKWLGRISYPTYLVHFPIVACLDRLLPATLNRPTHAVVLGLLVMPSVLVASALLHALVEKPLIRLGHRWLRPKIRLEREAQPVR